MGYGSATNLNVTAMTDTATWRATCGAISAAMEDAGWVKQSVTGTVDWATSTPGPAYEIWAPPDTAQATDPLYAHWTYNHNSGYLNVTVRVGRYASGLPASASTSPYTPTVAYPFYGSAYVAGPCDFHTAVGEGWGWAYAYDPDPSTPSGDGLFGYDRDPDTAGVALLQVGTTPNSTTGWNSRNYLYAANAFNDSSVLANTYNVPFAIPGPGKGSAGGDVDLFRQPLRTQAGATPFVNAWAVALARGEVAYGAGFTATVGGVSSDWLAVPSGPTGSQVTDFCIALRTA